MVQTPEQTVHKAQHLWGLRASGTGTCSNDAELQAGLDGSSWCYFQGAGKVLAWGSCVPAVVDLDWLALCLLLSKSRFPSFLFSRQNSSKCWKKCR